MIVGRGEGRGGGGWGGWGGVFMVPIGAIKVIGDLALFASGRAFLVIFGYVFFVCCQPLRHTETHCSALGMLSRVNASP